MGTKTETIVFDSNSVRLHVGLHMDLEPLSG